MNAVTTAPAERKYVPSKNYWIIWITAAVIFVGWYTEQTLITFAVLAIMAGLFLALFDESLHALPALWMFYYAISGSSMDLTGKAIWLVAFVFPFLGAAIHIIRFKPKVFCRKNLCKGFTVSLIFAGLAIAIGGIGMPDRKPVVVLVIVALGVLLPLGYMFISATITKSAGKPLLDYVAMIMFTVGLILTAQFIVYYARIGNIEGIKHDIYYKLFNVGWGGANNIAPTISIAIPIGIYYSLKKSRFSWAFLLLSAIQYGIIIASSSRGTILIVTAALPLILLYAFFKTENRLQFTLTVGIILLVAIALAIVFFDKLYAIFERMLNMKLDDNGRFELYSMAWNNFLSRPIFGVGFDYNLGGFKHNSYTPFWYHSTPMQILCCMGAFGFVVYAVFYFWRYRTFLLSRNTPIVLAICAGLFLYDMYSWVDVNFFPPNSFIIMLIMTLAAEKNLTEEQAMPYTAKLIYYLKGERKRVI